MFLENICIYSHVIGLVTHMLDCRDLPSAGRASEGIYKWVYGMPTDKEVGIRRIPAYTLHYTTAYMVLL